MNAITSLKKHLNWAQDGVFSVPTSVNNTPISAIGAPSPFFNSFDFSIGVVHRPTTQHMRHIEKLAKKVSTREPHRIQSQLVQVCDVNDTSPEAVALPTKISPTEKNVVELLHVSLAALTSSDKAPLPHRKPAVRSRASSVVADDTPDILPDVLGDQMVNYGCLTKVS
jgi:hypothetical protein